MFFFGGGGVAARLIKSAFRPIRIGGGGQCGEGGGAPEDSVEGADADGPGAKGRYGP